MRRDPSRYSRVMARARPTACNAPVPQGLSHGPARPKALERWDPSLRAADGSETADNVIVMNGVVGEDWFGEGITLSQVDAQLRAMAGKDVEVHLNSPGGDMFEGIAIFNRLRDYSGNVTVKVLGLAASAASLIAMAGDNVLMGPGSFIMVHESWVVAVGNKGDMRDTADQLAVFDDAMAQIYVERTGLPKDEIVALMEAETFLSPDQAVAKGFADAIAASGSTKSDSKAQADGRARNAVRQMESILCHDAKLSRSQARELIGLGKQAGAFSTDGKPGAAADPVTPDAGLTTADILAALIIIQS